MVLFQSKMLLILCETSFFGRKLYFCSPNRTFSIENFTFLSKSVYILSSIRYFFSPNRTFFSRKIDFFCPKRYCFSRKRSFCRPNAYTYIHTLFCHTNAIKIQSRKEKWRGDLKKLESLLEIRPQAPSNYELRVDHNK